MRGWMRSRIHPFTMPTLVFAQPKVMWASCRFHSMIGFLTTDSQAMISARCRERRRSGQPVRQVRLAPLERSILAQLVRCHSNKTIADILEISPRTVANYLSALSNALDANGRAELVRWTLLYPRVLAGAPAPVTLHAEGCRCESSYCRLLLVSRAALSLKCRYAADRETPNRCRSRAT